MRVVQRHRTIKRVQASSEIAKTPVPVFAGSEEYKLVQRSIFVRASDPTEDGMGLLHFLFSERYEKHGNLLTTNRHAPDN